ncbi:hypothetical protein [Rhizobium rhizogenes]|uniref:hypothetical protein n=1 Tax=Rhizobium rhizogenes TaxID=359 RepID=UPI0015740513|nr:hypothetical protein [Rhizobium rhizogenes]NTF67914.1 hypothetical protein [Rhizobium rhizogenes]
MGEANEKLMLAVDNLLGAYGKKYRLARGGIRENAPCRKEVAELWVVYNDIQTAHLNHTPAPKNDPAPEKGSGIPCPCTTFEQDEDCYIGFPSLLCSACDGKGVADIETVTALAAEMLKVAEQVGELEDPFAAWESIELLKSPAPEIAALPQDVINLVIAAREVFEAPEWASDEWNALDKALEVFSSRVPYENEPDAVAPEQEEAK